MSNDLVPPTDARFYASALSGAAMEAFPSQDYYRAMRHRELSAYRLVLQCIAMHQRTENRDGGADQQDDDDDDDDDNDNNQKGNMKKKNNIDFSQLSREQRRLIEDLELELNIPASRREAELADASQSVAVAAVRASGVAFRRPLHFDGINDVPLSAVDPGGVDFDGGGDTDDDGAVVAVGNNSRAQNSGRRGGGGGGAKPSNDAAAAGNSKTSRAGGGAASSSASSRKNHDNNNNNNNESENNESKPLDAATSAHLKKLSAQVSSLAKEYVLVSDSSERVRKGVELRRLKNEVETLREKAAKLCTAVMG